MAELPALVRTHYLRERKIEILPGGGEQVLYRLFDGRVLTNWDLIHTPEYLAFKRGFQDGFVGRMPRAEENLRADYDCGFRHGSQEREKSGS